MSRLTRRLTLAFALLSIVGPAAWYATRPTKPRLVLLLVVDQLRGDMPWRFYDRFGERGLRYLMDEGVAYKQARYLHATTFTAVGHATLATGGHAAQHGFPGNDWFDQKTGKRVYCVEDEACHILGEEPKAHTGTSPKNLTSSTFGDELVLASGGASRVFTVSIKDRGAIIPAGRLGKAYWYHKDHGEFVTSNYYYDQAPGWVADWNAQKPASVYRDSSWDLLEDRSRYLYGDADDRPSEKAYKHLGRTFPHPLGCESDKDFHSALRFTPMGDELTLDFAEELMRRERVGMGDATDVLSVSLSATDYIGHAFGPNSLEAEDNLLRLDRALGRFLTFVDQEVGLENTLVVLSADHGVDASPEALLAQGLPAGRHNAERFTKQVNDGLKERLNVDRDLVASFWNPAFYLDLEAVDELELDVERVERALVEETLELNGFACALTRTDLSVGRIAEEPIRQMMQRSFHPRRSGNVVVAQSPSWFLYPGGDDLAAMHGSPYAYDTYVPIFFAGSGLDGRVVERLVAPRDIASTIAGVLGIQPPSGSTGTPLVEVLESR